ncbi:MAG: hypothetical protein ACYSW8_22045 [Planctomycetota bacterium]|jgi:hypothetical protein
MNISLVPVEHVSSVWNDVRDYLEPAVEITNGRWTMEHLCAAISMGRTQLWIAFDDEEVKGAMTTELTSYPAKTVLAMHFLGGKDFDDWYSDMLRQITRYALDCGCQGIEGVARFGFWKWLQEDGFKKSSAFYEKEV